MIHDPSDEELYQLQVDMSTGKTESVLPPTNQEYNDLRTPEETLKLPVVPIERQQAMPKSGFRMRVQPVTDQAWRSKFGRQANGKVAAVMEHAKTLFKHASLVTKYELEVLPVQNYPGTLTATGPNLK